MVEKNEKTTKSAKVASVSVFNTLNNINVSKKVQQKNGYNYLSWAYAWGELKKHYPDSTYKIVENENGWPYHTDGATAWVKVSVTVQGSELVEIYPITDFRNNSIPLEQITSRAVNDSCQRALVRCIARHGLGLYIYAGEDVPEEDSIELAKQKAEAEALLKGKREKVKKALEGLDVDGVLALYKKKSIDELNLKKCENILEHLDQIRERFGGSEIGAEVVEADEAKDVKAEAVEEAPTPKKSAPKAKEPTCVAEAVVVPCSLSSKEIAGKSMGQIFGEGHIDKLKWIAEEYKGNDNAMRVAAQIILKENGAK